MKLTKTRIWFGDQQMMYPQQTISEVTIALRPTALVAELPAGDTYRKPKELNVPLCFFWHSLRGVTSRSRLRGGIRFIKRNS